MSMSSGGGAHVHFHVPDKSADKDVNYVTGDNVTDRSSACLITNMNERGSNLVRQKSVGSGSLNALYEEDPVDVEIEDDTGKRENVTTLAAYLKSFTIPGSDEKEALDKGVRKQARLGVLLGVYLPTIQHIFGVIMFLRLFWIVGIAGVVESTAMIFMCCLTTFLTSISMSAIATNGVVESGGSYFMISRNLGPEFGTAVGILFYIANAVATSMYLVGTTEIFLEYIWPQAPQLHYTTSSGEVVHDTLNNIRLYGTLFLFLVFLVVLIGVRFVQLFAPISLACVIISILAVYAGAFSAHLRQMQKVCLLDDKLLRFEVWHNGTAEVCFEGSTIVHQRLCANASEELSSYCSAAPEAAEGLKLVEAFPGFSSGIIKDNLWSHYLKKEPENRQFVVQDLTTTFFVLLAIYFPSVTGIMTGSNMSGDLKDPQRSIPSGTIAAQLTTSFVYLTYIFLFGGTVHGAVLRDKYGESIDGGLTASGEVRGGGMVVAKLAWPHEWVLLVGSFTSTFGAGLQCLCSAPRLLQSIAKDRVLPFLDPFAVVSSRNEPIRALLITTLISEAAVLIGQIDHIAPVVDFFFLMCYAFVNVICAMQTLMKSPNWRPRFRFYHWTLSLCGALLCTFVMFATHWYYAIIVIALCAAIYKYVEYKGAKKEWGDGTRGLALSAAQYSLLRVEDQDPHPKNWRPQLLVLVKPDAADPEIGPLATKHKRMLALCAQLKAGQGLTMVLSCLRGDLANHHDRERAAEFKETLRHEMRAQKVRGFANVITCSDIESSIDSMLQCSGIGGLRPNTVVVAWPDGWKDIAESQDTSDDYFHFLEILHAANAAGMCLLMPKGLETFPTTTGDKFSGTVDVWWIMQDGGLLILLPFLLKKHKVWRHCRLRVFAVAQLRDNSVKMKQELERWCYQLRIGAHVDVVEMPDSDISAYTHEKTLRMEERTKMIKDLHLSLKEAFSEPQLVLERTRESSASLPKAEVTMQPDGTANAQLSQSASTPGIQQQVKAAMRKFSIEPVRPRFQIAAAPAAATGPTVPTLSIEPSTDDEDDEAKKLVVDGSASEGPDGEREDGCKGDGGAGGGATLSTNGLSTPTGQEGSHGQNQFTFTPAALREEMQRQTNAAKLSSQPSFQKKVKKMHTAINLNKIVTERSSDAALVVLNLPRAPRHRAAFWNYMDYLEVLTEGLDRVLLVRGTGKEVITIYS